MTSIILHSFAFPLLLKVFFRNFFYQFYLMKLQIPRHFVLFICVAIIVKEFVIDTTNRFGTETAMSFSKLQVSQLTKCWLSGTKIKINNSTNPA